MNTRSRKSCFWGVERCRCVGLTTLPPSVSRSSTSHNSIGLHGLLRGQLYITVLYLSVQPDTMLYSEMRAPSRQNILNSELLPELDHSYVRLRPTTQTAIGSNPAGQVRGSLCEQLRNVDNTGCFNNMFGA
jgi:hypothetical protein